MDKKTAKTLHMVALVLVIVGALNWGLIGLLNFNLVNTIFGALPAAEKLIYVLVGASALVVATNMNNK